METLEQLQEDLAVAERARDYLSTRSHWARSYLYARGFIFPKVATRDTATRGCAMGVLYMSDPAAEDVHHHVSNAHPHLPSARVIDRMGKYVRQLSNDNLAHSVDSFNDQYGYRKVLDLFDLTIADLMREIQGVRSGLTEPSIPIQVPEPARQPVYVPLPDVRPNTAPGPTPEPEPVTVPEEDPDLVPA